MGALAQTVEIPETKTSFWERYVVPSDPDRSCPMWHISPVIDMAAYHFSWVWILVPMIAVSMIWHVPYNRGFNLNLFALVVGINIAHRHFGLPYAYFDDEVFRTHQRQLTWFPLICIAMLAMTPVFLDPQSGGPIGAGVVTTVVFFSVAWNLWHVYMQKFGILRLYMAKDPAPVEKKTAAWVDKYFLFCWFPLYLSYLGPTYKTLIIGKAPSVVPYTSAIVRFMERYQAWLLAPSAMVAAGGVGVWLWYEWRAHQFHNRARLSAAAGTLIISTALFWTDPVKAYIAFGFSHAIEYLAFVWAFQRRRYRRPQARPCLMQQLLRHPAIWYALFIGIFAAAGILKALWGRTILIATDDTEPLAFFGITLFRWIFYYEVYQSLVHFYLDGFLWKMRRPEVRENI